MALSQWVTAVLSLSLFARSARSQSTEPACGQIVNALGGMNSLFYLTFATSFRYMLTSGRPGRLQRQPCSRMFDECSLQRSRCHSIHRLLERHPSLPKHSRISEESPGRLSTTSSGPARRLVRITNRCQQRCFQEPIRLRSGFAAPIGLGSRCTSLLERRHSRCIHVCKPV